MDPTTLVIMLVVGAIAGWLASFIVGGLKFGLLGYIIAGLIGGVVGPMLLNALKVKFDLGSAVLNSIITSAIGAIVVILLARLLL